MAKVALNTQAPDFSLTGFDGTKIMISDFHDKKNVLLIFNRGFA